MEHIGTDEKELNVDEIRIWPVFPKAVPRLEIILPDGTRKLMPDSLARDPRIGLRINQYCRKLAFMSTIHRINSVIWGGASVLCGISAFEIQRVPQTTQRMIRKSGYILAIIALGVEIGMLYVSHRLLRPF